MVLKVARRGQVPPFIVMDVMQAAADREAAGGEVLHLEVGQPASSAPEPVLEAARLNNVKRCVYTASSSCYGQAQR